MVLIKSKEDTGNRKIHYQPKIIDVTLYPSYGTD